MPAFAVPLTWNFLTDSYATWNTSVDAKLHAFATYFKSTWWVNGDFDPHRWTHYDHLGPRTTNLAEGFHDSLNTRFGMLHPSSSSDVLGMVAKVPIWNRMPHHVAGIGSSSKTEVCCLQQHPDCHNWTMDYGLFVWGTCSIVFFPIQIHGKCFACTRVTICVAWVT